MAGSRVPGPTGTSYTVGTEENELERHSPSSQAVTPGPNDAIATDGGTSGKGGGGGGSGSLILTLLGDFDNPWKGNPKAEADAIDNKIWEPATDTFDVVARHPNNNISKQEVKVCPAFTSFLGFILNASGQIARINVISHTNSGLVAFGGTIDAKKKSVMLNVNQNPGDFTAMDSAALVELRDESKEWFLDKQKFTIKGLRQKFAENAEIVLYACGSGFNLAFLRDVALTFKVRVRGFKAEIVYFAQWNNTGKNQIVITRTETAYNNPPANPLESGHQSGFMHLQSDISAAP
jgi:hypothetical protein